MPSSFIELPADPQAALTQILSRAAAHGLTLDAPTARLDPSGLDSLVVHATDRQQIPWILRAPRRPDVAAGAVREGAALAFLRPLLPVAVPDWRISAADLVGYPRLPGVPTWTYDAEAGLSWALPDPMAPPEAFVHDLVALLGALHRVDLQAAAAAGLPTRTPEAVRAELRGQLSTVAALHPIPDSVQAAWRHTLDEAPWPSDVGLTHGDLHPGHLLIDADAHLCGVLDWTEAAVGDPTLDLVSLLACLGAPVFERVLAGLAAGPWPEVRALTPHIERRVALIPLIMLAWAHEHGSEVPVPHALAMIAAQAG